MPLRSDSVIALQDMALFVAVARALSFTRASEHSGIPIATLSRRISLMEKRSGVRLFERTTRRLTLTEPGRRYLERCERIVQEADIAQDVLKDSVERISGHIRVSTPVEFGIYNISPILDEFARYYPDITMELDLTSRPANFIDGQTDVGIRLGEVRDQALIARRLGSSARILYAAPSYLARRGTPRTPDDLKDHDCILLSYMSTPGVWRLVADSETRDIPVHGRFNTNKISMTLKLAEYGYGVAALPSTIARAAFDAGAIRQVLDDWSFPPMPVHALTTSRLLPARVRVFIDFLASRLAV
jgi:DNA-binding transcriptional LysR family regulator